MARPLRKLASAPSRSPFLLQHLADAVVADRQVVLPDRVLRIALGQRLGDLEAAADSSRARHRARPVASMHVADAVVA